MWGIFQSIMFVIFPLWFPQSKASSSSGARKASRVQNNITAAEAPSKAAVGGGKVKGRGGCPHFMAVSSSSASGGVGEEAWEDFTDSVLGQPLDVEVRRSVDCPHLQINDRCILTVRQPLSSTHYVHTCSSFHTRIWPVPVPPTVCVLTTGLGLWWLRRICCSCPTPHFWGRKPGLRQSVDAGWPRSGLG